MFFTTQKKGYAMRSVTLSIILSIASILQSLQADITVQTYYGEVFRAKSASAIIREDLSSISANPNVVVWGIGAQGLTDRSLDFYEEEVFIPLKETFVGETTSRCFFYDLATWDYARWRNKGGRPSATFEKKYAGAKDLEAFFAGEGYAAEVFYGSNLFTAWMPGLTPAAEAYIRETVLNREFIWEKSKTRNPKGTFVKRTLLGAPASLFSAYADLRIDFMYSPLQYVEAIFLVNELVSRGVRDITLLLPNDEFDYYVGSRNQFLEVFQEDLNKAISLNTEGDLPEIKLNLVPFKYGRTAAARPYTFKKYTDSLVSWQ
jgi:hypothetical protein